MVDMDFKIDELKADLESFSLFNEETIIILNVLATSIPKNLKNICYQLKYLTVIKSLLLSLIRVLHLEKQNFLRPWLKNIVL